ncbi:putative peroxiredoxin-like 2A/B/C [Helianthus debilis subsp. tardiflorus]
MTDFAGGSHVLDDANTKVYPSNVPEAESPFSDPNVEGIAVVALLRHFGCPCCWELASTLKESKARFEAVVVKLIAVGIDEPKKARILAERIIISFLYSS